MTEKLRLLGDHLEPNPRRKSAAQSGGLVPCSSFPRTHGHHPEYELCPDCDPRAERRLVRIRVSRGAAV